MINNRQAGRRRGRGGQQQRPQGNSGARDNGNRIDNRSRGNAAQLLEKYKALARDSQMSGDRVNTEYYLQFADHYFRVLAETRSRFEENRQPVQGGANTFQDDEQDYDDEGEPVVRAEQPRQNESRPDNRQDGRQQSTAQGYQGDRQNRDGAQDRPIQQQDRHQQDRPSGDRSERAERGQYDDDRPRRQNGNGNGGGYANDQAPDRYVREDRGNRNAADRGNRERYQNDDRAPVSQDAAPPRDDADRDDAPRAEAPRQAEEQQQEAPRRRGRPRREPAAEAPAAFEADRLPPSLTLSATPPAAEPQPANDEVEEKPRRRRGRPPASEASTA